MRKIMLSATFIISSMLFIQCNNSATGDTSSDTSAHQADTTKTQIVTEGGLKDSIATGASDTTTKKDPVKN